MSTQQIANRLVALCRDGQFEKAYDELFADDARNVEMPAMSEGPLGSVSGLPAMRRKSTDFMAAVEQMHSMSCGDAVVSGNWFAVPMSIDATMKGMGRMQTDEICLYQVRDGKIVLEQFFYDTP